MPVPLYLSGMVIIFAFPVCVHIRTGRLDLGKNISFSDSLLEGLTVSAGHEQFFLREIIKCSLPSFKIRGDITSAVK